ncbi:hypothetical protein J6590_083796 [Homalodisca vitripennis]|nr:hypothetical protein J6590_083796 [Homalodisca vitripennis]
MSCLYLMALCLAVWNVDSARILVFQVSGAKSHTVVMEPLFEELAARGHQLTSTMSSPFKTSIFMMDIEFNVCKHVLPDENVEEVFESTEHFNLVMTETFLCSLANFRPVSTRCNYGEFRFAYPPSLITQGQTADITVSTDSVCGRLSSDGKVSYSSNLVITLSESRRGLHHAFTINPEWFTSSRPPLHDWAAPAFVTR